MQDVRCTTAPSCQGGAAPSRGPSSQDADLGHRAPSASPNVRRLIRSGKCVPAPSRNPTQPIVRRWTCVQKRSSVPCPFIFRNLFFPGQRPPLERAEGEPPSSPSTPMATVCRWSAPRRVPPWTPRNSRSGMKSIRELSCRQDRRSPRNIGLCEQHLPEPVEARWLCNCGKAHPAGYSLWQRLVLCASIPKFQAIAEIRG